MCLKTHLSLFFCSVTKEVVSDKCRLFPTHCIQKGRATLSIPVGKRYSMSFPHSTCIIFHQQADICAALPMLEGADRDGATYPIPTSCSFPPPPQYQS